MTLKTGKILLALLLLAGASIIALPAQQRDFPYPAIPDSLRTQQGRADFLVLHYWDNVDFDDNSFFNDKVLFNRSFANFLSVFPLASDSACEKGVGRLVELGSQKINRLPLIARTAREYLFEPLSPLYNEERFRLFAEQLAGSPLLPTRVAADMASACSILSSNKIGSKAVNFRYATKGSAGGSLHSLKAEQLLVLFYDPECDHCLELISKLAADNRISARISEGCLKVLAVYADGDRKIWKDLEQYVRIPDTWISALDISGIQRKGFYILRSLPALYLLDADKTIIARHLSLSQLTELL